MDRKVFGAAVAVIALVAGGCGSSSKPLTRTAFVQRADAACRQAVKAAEQRSGRAASGPEAFAHRVMRGVRREADELDKLTPPKELQSAFAAYKQDLVQFENLVARYLPAVKARNRAELEAINREGAAMGPKREAHKKALGISNCL